MSILKRGMKGAPVKRLQEKLGLSIDGDFGPATEKALKAYQEKNDLVADGIAGPDTFTVIGLPELILLRQGSRGEAVKLLQMDLGIDADGKFGPGTKKAVQAFQEKNGLNADGIAGPNTLSKMLLFAGMMTPATVKLAEVQPDEEHFEAEPMPEVKGAEPVKGETVTIAETSEEKSVWGKVTGWFS
ncbi:Peptidoglycan-binding (PGRP) domain of peptidoglycan hydrolases-containing protein [Cognatiyoonia koreensis]|uniref:Peptidoglycan-binding (PGRP) domain of peptidoglycan hydrolases-containing protein n=1 Tax=Cognatiyoonia koreensis TaxID=364200 RepID=A0A1I0MU96_9RHOB|nr:peptidoglycan-binding protein [Cognatiyoonia koreensis]SEV92296.1 Peptidoglycan-binding (PGRP) domain of peptidoglycan hydrolases-containing protein [Cognatiyoonia koreensis]